VLTVFTVVLTAAFPLLFLLSKGRIDARWLALPLLLLAALGVVRRRERGPLGRFGLVLAAAVVVLGALSWSADDPLPAKLYPVLVNLALLAQFGWTLAFPPSFIERIARLREPRLPQSGVRYTRAVTWVWCAFFTLNAAAALATTLWFSDAVWAWYNGCIAYVLIGMLFAGEWLVRGRVRRLARDG
jgi:uncharacterized membrane protein